MEEKTYYEFRSLQFFSIWMIQKSGFVGKSSGVKYVALAWFSTTVRLDLEEIWNEGRTAFVLCFALTQLGVSRRQ